MVTVYLSSLTTSLIVLVISSGNGFPPSSADDGTQVPSMPLAPLASPLHAVNPTANIRVMAASSFCGIRHLGVMMAAPGWGSHSMGGRRAVHPVRRRITHGPAQPIFRHGDRDVRDEKPGKDQEARRTGP